MGRMKCMICGSENFEKQGPEFVCKDCETRYSFEEARQMMADAAAAAAPAAVAAPAEPAVDTARLLELAGRAIESGNNEEAESYANRVIEAEPDNVEALVYKGRAAGWQSTLAKPRIQEAVNCFTSALNFASDDKKSTVNDIAVAEITSMCTAYVKIQGDIFAKIPDKENCASLISVADGASKTALKYCFSAVSKGFKADGDKLASTIAQAVFMSASTAWNSVVLPEFTKENDGYPGNYAFDRFIERLDNCIAVTEYSIGLGAKDYDNNVRRYESIIILHRSATDAWGYEYRTVNVGSSWVDGSNIYENRYVQSRCLTDQAKAERKRLILKCNTAIEETKKKKTAEENRVHKQKIEQRNRERKERNREQNERNDKYWEEHAEKKALLESQYDDLSAKFSEISDPIYEELRAVRREKENLPEIAKRKELSEKIKNLSAEIDSLGFFKGKEKRALQEQIDKLDGDLKIVTNALEEKRRDADEKIKELNARIKRDTAEIRKQMDEITKELNKNR